MAYIIESNVSAIRYQGYADGLSDKQEMITLEGLDYVAAADRTSSNVFHPERVGRAELMGALGRFIASAQELDRYKKLLFRDRTREEMGFSGEVRTPTVGDLIGGATHMDLVHGIIGLATESGELAEVLFELMNQVQPGVDVTNVKEEIGDCLWYLSRLVKWSDTTFLTEMKRNIEKLGARHGATFDAERDANRDLATERAVLEGEV